MKPRRLRLGLYDADYNFSWARNESRPTLQAIVSYEHARESPYIRSALTVLFGHKASKAELQDVLDEKSFNGLWDHKRSEKEVLRFRLLQKIEMSGTGGIYLRDLAPELLADLPWSNIEPKRLEAAKAQAKKSPQDVRTDPVQTKFPDYGVRLASSGEAAKGVTTQLARQLPDRDGAETIALRVSWQGFSDNDHVAAFRTMLSKLRPRQYADSNAREGHKAKTQWKYLDDLSVMRALSVMPMSEVIAYRRKIGLSHRSTTFDNLDEAERTDLEKARTRAIDRTKALFPFDTGAPLHGSRYKK